MTGQMELKSDDKAQQARVIGNKYFCDKNYLYALINYNKSIAYAKTESVAALGYANRSAVYYEALLFAESLHNIQLDK